MLTIRKEQMAALGAYMRQSFEDRLITHLKGVLPQQVRRLTGPDLGEDKLRDLIRQGIKKGVGYGITTERDVARFLELMVRLAPDFEARSHLKWAAAILGDPALPGQAKVELIHARLATDADDGDSLAGRARISEIPSNH